MPMKHRQSNSQRGFDAVAESRRWKKDVAAETAGMSIRERMALFRRQSSVPAQNSTGNKYINWTLE